MDHLQDSERLIISRQDVGRMIGYSARRVPDVCARHDVPMTKFGARKSGLTRENLALLLQRATALVKSGPGKS